MPRRFMEPPLSAKSQDDTSGMTCRSGSMRTRSAWPTVRSPPPLYRRSCADSGETDAMARPRAFHVGDLVRLRAGGPVAAVQTEPAPDLIDGNAGAWVQIMWFTNRGVARKAGVAVASLEKVVPQNKVRD